MQKYPSHAKETVALKRIEGQIRGIQNMVTEGKYCVDILTQIHAVMGALARVEDNILERHLEHCVSKAVKGKSTADRGKKFEELMALIKRFRRI